MRRGALVAVGAVAALVINLLVLPDIWEPPTGRLVTWLVLEAVLAVLIGLIAEDRLLARRTVLGGWLLQMVWFVVVTPKDEEHNLWGVGIVVLGSFGAVALGLALLTYRVRRRTGG